MEKSYESLSIAIDELKKEGYTEDFNLCDAGVENKSRKTIHDAGTLDVVNYYRFEGITNPDDSSVLYVIETSSGEKGLLVDAYGAYAGNVPREMIEKLKLK
ncbi:MULTISPECIES: phosphoribosylpyrophosphate synthetase [Galbibacter]|uniref:Phosphoribosylpyrophosphate synthetase n=1 Tax=Galbibacter pacificus TaxID=2996052 RepID=A0ABT6FVN9_9FLAO|nr:phosphoribosylpyrophosphate synthetase [Galbibacter pacificus]MDG3583372.1 phosphoribosylpyrophosphate synthetase [Galbibacter pacificus]MDG3587151.1 phosphoribosylpyrophosphate synthetase [Galbibacter pacificus]